MHDVLAIKNDGFNACNGDATLYEKINVAGMLRLMLLITSRVTSIIGKHLESWICYDSIAN